MEEPLQACGVKALCEKVGHEASGLFKYFGTPHSPVPIVVVPSRLRLPRR